MSRKGVGLPAARGVISLSLKRRRERPRLVTQLLLLQMTVSIKQHFQASAGQHLDLEPNCLT